VRKASVIPAAALAAVFLFALSSSSEGKSAKPSKNRPVASKGAASGRAQAQARKVPARKKAPAVKSKARSSKKARHVIRQRPGGAVVVDRVAVAMPQFYGPFLPVEVADYPRPLCDPIDVVLEAHVHETDEETPEPETIADDMPE